MEYGKFIVTKKELLMKKILVIALLNILTFSVFAGCASAIRVDGPYEGRIIDADTREPIEGVVVLGVWSKEYPTVAGATHKYHDAEETVTDRNGEFVITGKGVLVLSNVIHPRFLIFKAGYSYEEGSYSSFKEFAKEIKWEGEKAIIPLKKLTMDGRKKYGMPSRPNIPLEKMMLLTEEINKERVAQGATPFDLDLR